MVPEDSIIRIRAVEPLNPPVSLVPSEIVGTGRATLKDVVTLQLESRTNASYVAWIDGLKGILAVQSFLWLYLRTFAPATVYSGVLNPEPGWQTIFRKLFSPLLWDGTLQWSFFIILSGRTAALSFMNDKTSNTIARSIFQRPFRFILPVVIAMSLSALINYCGGFDHISRFAVVAKNNVSGVPFKYKTVLAWLNSMFNLFWFNDALQAGVLAHPGSSLWVISTTFQESYTIYMTMLLLPYMTRTWRVQLLMLFVLAAWWVNSWAWYSVTGLLLADNVPTLARWGQTSWHIDIDKSKIKFSLPYWSAPAALAFIGAFLKYFYAGIRPDLYTNELNAHTSTYLVGGTIEGYVDYSRPAMRLDNYFTVLGTLLLIEMTPWLQRALSNKFLRYLGHLAFSSFLLQGLISYTIGVRLFLHLVGTLEWNTMSAGIVILVVDGSLTWLFSDLYARFVDSTGRWFAMHIYEWYKE